MSDERAREEAEERERRPLRIEISMRTLLTAALVVIGIWLVIQLFTVVVIVVIALVLVGTLDPMIAWLERRGLRRGWALALVFASMLAALVGIVLLSIPPLLDELKTVVESLPKYQARVAAWMNDRSWAAQFASEVHELKLKDYEVRVAQFSINQLGVLGYGVTTIFLAIYLLADPRHAKGILFAIVPRHHHLKLARVLLELKVIVGGYMRGQVITSVAIAIFMFVLMTACGVDSALSIAIFAGMTDIIPFVGGYVATAPSVAAVAHRGPVWMLAILAAGMLYQEFESRILVPRVYGRVLRLSPALVLLALLIGGTLLGVLGALLALPIAAGLRMIVQQLRVELPGQPDLEAERERDERAVVLYEKLTAGTPAADAQIIAGELAQKIKQTEGHGGSLTAELPAIMKELTEDAREVAEQGEREAHQLKKEEAKLVAQAPVAGPDEPKST